jgi:hypothetical protein
MTVRRDVVPNKKRSKDYFCFLFCIQPGVQQYEWRFSLAMAYMSFDGNESLALRLVFMMIDFRIATSLMMQ